MWDNMLYTNKSQEQICVLGIYVFDQLIVFDRSFPKMMD